LVPRFDSPAVDLLVRFHLAMVAFSADDLADLHAIDAVYEFPFLTPGRPRRYVGREAIRQGFRAAWAGLPSSPIKAIRDVIVHQTCDPAVIVAEQTVDAVARGRRFSSSFLLVLRTREATVVHTRDYSDALRSAHAFGRLPAIAAMLADVAPEELG
jgi:uncharacterized protein